MGIEDGGPKDSASPAVVEPTVRQRAEEKARRMGLGLEDGEALSPEAARQLVHELRVHQIELEMQNEELRRTQVVLEASRERYFDLYDLAPVGYFTLSEKGLILEANLTAATLLKVPRGALVEQSLTRSIVPEDQDIYYRHRNRLFETGAPQVCELRMVCREARDCHFWARLESIVVEDTDSGAPVCRVTISDITERKRAEREGEELAAELGERVKELNCLYRISSLVEKPGISLEEVLQGTVDLIPPTWQYPEVCCARIILDGQEYSTGNVAQSPWQQAADISVHGEPCGAVQVGYLQERPESDEGPFLKEERSLLNVIAKRLGTTAEQMRTQQQVLQQQHFLQTVLDSLAHPFYVINVEDYAIEMANRAAYAGRPQGQLTCFALSHGQDQPCEAADHPCPLEEILISKEPVVVEHVHLDSLGRRQDVEVHGFPIFDSKGNVVKMIEYALDITDRKQAEMAVRESESRWRSLTQTSPDHILTLDADLKVQFANFPSPGLTIDELVGTPLHTLADEPRQAEIRAILEDVLRTGIPARYETVYHSPDGSDLYYESHVAPRTLAHTNQVVGLTLAARDITERKQAEQALRASEAKLRALLQIARSMTLTLELGPLLELILDGLTGVLAYDSAIIYQLKGKDLVALAYREQGSPNELGPESVQLVDSALAQRIVADQEPLLISDLRGHTDDALLTSVSGWACCGMAAPLGIRQQVVGLMIVYSSRLQSYTPQQAAVLLALANQAAVGIENAHLYQQAHSLAALEERQRLARDLHDAVSQTLFSANIIAEALPRLWDRNPENVRRRLPELHRLTSGALAEMRMLLLELRPTALVDVELSELLQQAVNAFSGRSQASASLILVGQHPLPEAVQIALYRIAQEALNNVAKHARATEVKVHLQMVTGRVELSIQDDGQGFDPDLVLPGRLGLRILHERARAIDASLHITSRPGCGTEVVAVWTEEL